MTMTVDECIRQLEASVENMDAAKTERIGSPSLGDVVRQGDIYLVCIESLPVGQETKNRQLAPGNTQGSRHIVAGDAAFVEVESFGDVPAVLVGPAFACNGDCTVMHPEHGDKVLPAGTTFQVIYQLHHADEIRRVQD
jgi:hypothetical protein